MSRLHLTAIGLSLIALLPAIPTHAQTTQTTVVEKRVIQTPAPKGTCTTIAAHWEGNEWRDTYTLCKYENRKEGVAWVSDYWSCNQYTADGQCTTWTLVPGHWVSTLQ